MRNSFFLQFLLVKFFLLFLSPFLLFVFEVGEPFSGTLRTKSLFPFLNLLKFKIF